MVVLAIKQRPTFPSLHSHRGHLHNLLCVKQIKKSLLVCLSHLIRKWVQNTLPLIRLALQCYFSKFIGKFTLLPYSWDLPLFLPTIEFWLISVFSETVKCEFNTFVICLFPQENKYLKGTSGDWITHQCLCNFLFQDRLNFVSNKLKHHSERYAWYVKV